MLDGVIIVVEANKTTSHQLAYLEKTIQGASGVVLGHILNKRTYPIPVWLNTQLERLGL
jgi:Mrp family chromosome partitioning ATPase